MSDYPTLRQGTDSTETRIGGRVVDRASNGVPRVRSFFTSEKKAFKVVHQFMNATQKGEIETFCSVNADSSFNFVWVPDGTTYVCIFDETNPTYTIVPGGFWNIEVFLLQI